MQYSRADDVSEYDMNTDVDVDVDVDMDVGMDVDRDVDRLIWIWIWILISTSISILVLDPRSLVARHQTDNLLRLRSVAIPHKAYCSWRCSSSFQCTTA